MIAIVDKNWAIGRDGHQLVSISADRAMFREATMGRIVVMGRKTWDSLDIRPLESRFNVVLSRDPKFAAKGGITVRSVDEALGEIDRLLVENHLEDTDVIVIGGGTVYRAFLPYCAQALITAVDYAYDADTDMPDLDAIGWRLTSESDEQTAFDLIYHYRLYERPED
jgi:dihydrofolate reductase